MNKQIILDQLDFGEFYKGLLPSMKTNGTAQAMALCPFHDDTNPSLSINVTNGTFNCFACGKNGDLFKFYMELNNVDFKTALNSLAEHAGVEAMKRTVESFQYQDPDGNLIYIKERIEPGRGGRKKEFIFKHKEDGQWIKSRGHEPLLYNLPALSCSDYCFIVEGEAKVDLLDKWKLVATCLDSGAQSPWKDNYLKFFEGKKSVVIFPDNDEPGNRYAEKIATAICRKVKSIKIINLPDLDSKEDIIDWANKTGNSKEKLLLIIQQAPEWTPDKKNTTTWDHPILFDDLETPEIPASLLPGWLGDFARELSVATETPEAMSVFAALGVVSAVVTKRFVVTPKSGWREPVNIYAIIALPPANNKSKVLNACTEPLIEWEREQAKELEPEIKRKISERKTLEGRIDYLRKKIQKVADIFKRKELQDEIIELENDLPVIPVLPKMFVNDTTPESLITQVYEQNGRFAIIGDEGGIFEVISGLYSSGSANVDIILKGIDGGHLRVRRKEKNYDLNPYISFVMTVQPIIVQNMGAKKSFTGNGMRERFLYLLPKSRLGYRTHTTPPVSDDVRNLYHTEIKKLLNIKPQLNEFNEEVPFILTLEPDAHKKWRAFQDFIEVELKPEGKLYPLLGWGGKLCGYTLRVAGLLHTAEFGMSSFAINPSTMTRAIIIAELLIEHTIAAFNLTGIDEPTEDAKHVFRWILNREELQFKRNDCHRALQGRIRRVKRLRKALEILTERNIISQEIKLPTKKPTIVYDVNPSVF